MSRASVVLRGLFRRERARFDFGDLSAHEIGVYVLGEESSIAGFDMTPVWAALDGPATHLTESFRAIPAKGFVGLPMSRVGAQLATESGARGPLTCVHFEMPAVEFVLGEIAADFASGAIRGFLLAAFQERVRDFAYLGFARSWNGGVRTEAQAALEDFFKEGAP